LLPAVSYVTILRLEKTFDPDLQICLDPRPCSYSSPWSRAASSACPVVLLPSLTTHRHTRHLASFVLICIIRSFTHILPLSKIPGLPNQHQYSTARQGNISTQSQLTVDEQAIGRRSSLRKRRREEQQHRGKPSWRPSLASRALCR
jgi:hypothetical protein